MNPNTGMPPGYDQQQPFLDTPNPKTPGQPGRPASPVQQAVMGPAQSPSDPSMLAWKSRQPGQQQQIQPLKAPDAPAADPFAMPEGDWKDPGFVAHAMQQANDAAYGYQKHTDPSYWTQPEFNGDGAYIWKRMLGDQAGGADAARMGPYAGQAHARATGQITPLMSAASGGGEPLYKTLLQQMLQSLPQS